MDDGDHYEENDSSSESSSCDGTPVASTGIIMLSLPDSSEEEEGDNNHDDVDNNNNSAPDVFQTPPEYSHPGTSDEDRKYEDVGDGRGIIVAVGGDDGGEVDLGRDAELGFAEVELMEFKVLKRELSPGGVSAVSPLKKLRICSRDSEPEGESPYNLSSGSRRSREIDGGVDEKLGEKEGSAKKKKLEFSDNESDDATTEEDGSVLGVVDSDEEGVGSDASDDTTYRCGRQRRVLPRSVGGQAELNVKSGEGHKKFSNLLNNVVKLLKERSGDGDGDDEDDIKNCSFLEIYMRPGMT